MAGENLPIISNRKIDIKSYVPEYLKYKSDGDFYEFIGVFEEYLNTMYINKTNGDQEALSILEKIESLKTLQDAWEIDFEYINHFAKYLGFKININTDDFSSNIYGKPFIELDSDEQEVIKKHVRQFVKTLPSWYRIKSTKNSIRAMLYSFGLVSDIIEKYTLDYNSTGINWIDVPLDDTQTLPPGYYPTPHFGISVEVGNYAETIRIPIPGCTPTEEFWINSFDSNFSGVMDSSGINKTSITGLESIDKFIGTAFRYKRKADDSYPTVIEFSNSTDTLLKVYQDLSFSYELVISIEVGGALKLFKTITPFETLFPLNETVSTMIYIDVTDPLAYPKVILNGSEYGEGEFQNGYAVFSNDPIASFPVSNYNLKSYSDGSELSDLYYSTNANFSSLSSITQYVEDPNALEDNRPYYTGKERFTQVAPDVVPTSVNSFIGNGVDSGVQLGNINSLPPFLMASTKIIMGSSQTTDIVFNFGGVQTNVFNLVGYTEVGEFKVYSGNSINAESWSAPLPLIEGATYSIQFSYSDATGVQVWIDGISQILTNIYLAPPPPQPSTLELLVGINQAGGQVGSSTLYDTYWSTDINSTLPSSVAQYAEAPNPQEDNRPYYTGKELFTQVAPDALPSAWLGGAVQGEVELGWLGGAVQGDIQISEENDCMIEEVITVDSTLPTWYNNITRLTDIVSQVRPINTVFDGFVSKFTVLPDFEDDQKIQIRSRVFPYYGTYIYSVFRSQYFLDEGFGLFDPGSYYISNAGMNDISSDLENYVPIDGQIS